VYGTSVWLPTSADVEHPSAGATPARVFNLWMKLVLDSIVPPEGPGWEPMDCSSRQGMESVFEQVGSEPAGMLFECSTCAQTVLVSNELCHVALPKGSGFGAASLGLASGLRKWVAIWTSCPKTRWKRVASGEKVSRSRKRLPRRR
jgi:hypothetical protein